MNDLSLSNIQKVGVESTVVDQTLYQSDELLPGQSMTPKPAAKAPQETQRRNPHSDIHLQFLVDNETKEVTVLILDRASRRVIRTIPPTELNNLKEGDLVSLFT